MKIFEGIKKRNAAVLLLCLAINLAAAATDRHNTYTVTRSGKKICTANWNVTGSTVDVKTGNIQRTVLSVTSSGKTTSWHFTGNGGKNDYRMSLQNGVYTLQGKLDGKENVTKTYKSDGHPWYQLINYSMGVVLNDKCRTVTYECFLPANARFITMCATIQGEVEYAGHHAWKVKSATTGIIKNLWSCTYYMDKTTGQFLGYEGVEGGPGTDTTYWKID